MADISFLAAPVGGEGSTLVVPPNVIEDFEATYAYLVANPGQIAFIEEADADQLKTWFKYARAYAGRRPDGALKIRQLPSKHLPGNKARFTIFAAATDTG